MYQRLLWLHISWEWRTEQSTHWSRSTTPTTELGRQLLFSVRRISCNTTFFGFDYWL